MYKRQLLDSIDQLFGKYNAFLQENDYGVKYGLGNAQMFVIEGMDKVREVIEKNRKRKLAKHKKLSNNRIIEIDNCSPLEIRKLQNNLTTVSYTHIDVYKRQHKLFPVLYKYGTIRPGPLMNA